MVSERLRFTIDDLYELAWLEDVQVSPNSRFVAYVQVTVDRVQNNYRRAIYLVRCDGRQPRRFTQGKHDTTPRWSPDGERLAFVSRRDDTHGQIYTIALDGGEAQQLTNVPNGASDPAWNPDGTKLAFLSRVSEAECQAEVAEQAGEPLGSTWEIEREHQRRQRENEQRIDPRVVTRLPYRSGTEFFDNRRQHIYVVDAPAGNIDTLPKPQRITDGDTHHSAPVWLPHGRALLTTATRDPEADSLFAYYDVLQIAAEGGKPTTLTTAGYSYFDPQPSPDGTLIAFRRVPEDQLLSAGHRVAIIPSQGGEPQSLTSHTDLNVDCFAWQPDSQGIVFSAGREGDAHIYAIGLEGYKRTQGSTVVAGHRIVDDFSVSSDGTIAFIAGSPTDPCNLFVHTPEGHETQLTQSNAALISARQIAPTEEIRFLAPDAVEVQGWAIYPPDFDPEQQYPLAVYIHGGPHVMWGPGFRSMWHEWQTAAAQGYMVFFCNPRGSEGYGEQWRDAIRADWGNADSPDILAGIDYLIERGYIDQSRIAVTGGSYGGYMTTWLISHGDRFACAIAARGVFNLLTEHSTSDAHELIEHEFNGYPWELYEELWYHSPLAHAHKINTPLLILHGELDYRVPISEAEQLFALLRRQKKTVEMVRYPREGHEITRTGEPRHRADHMQRTLEWFDRYCKPTDQQ